MSHFRCTLAYDHCIKRLLEAFLRYIWRQTRRPVENATERIELDELINLTNVIGRELRPQAQRTPHFMDRALTSFANDNRNVTFKD